MRTYTSRCGRIARVALLSLGTGAAAAGDLLGLQVGASAGVADWAINPPVAAGYPSLHHTGAGWKIFAESRPLSLLGAEISYADFGSRRQQPNQGSNSTAGVGADYARVTAFSAMVLGFLPLRLSTVDVYLKLGAAQLNDVNEQSGCVGDVAFGQPCLPIARARAWRTEPAYGAGSQLHMGHLALRAEFERIHRPAGSVSFGSIGAGWLF